jgi:hypothetical protein
MVRMKVPFKGKSSKQPRFLGKQQQRARASRHCDSPTNKYYVSPGYSNNTTPSVVSTNSDSSGTGNEVRVDWATATSVASQVVEAEPLKKKRTRSFRDRVFRARRSFAIKADNKRSLSFIEPPTHSSTLTQIPMAGDDTMMSHDTTRATPEESQTLNVRTLSLKKLAPPKPDGSYSLLDDDESSAFYKKQDRYATAAADNQEDGEELNSGASSENKDASSIPLSYFLRKKSSWGLSTKTETSQSEQDSQQVVLQERHWGKKLRLRSRDGSTSWIPTDEERYKISQGFASDKEDTDTEDDGSSGGWSFATGSVSTATGLSTFVTRNTGATGESEETNDTTSAFTGHYTGDSRYDSTSSESISTNKTVVTGTTGDTSMFSLGVDEDSESETSSFYPRQARGRSPAKRQKRRLVKSDKNILVEVFSDLRLLIETMADEENGVRSTCLACA